MLEDLHGDRYMMVEQFADCGMVNVTVPMKDRQFLQALRVEPLCVWPDSTLTWSVSQ
jgi:hypothetical protein